MTLHIREGELLVGNKTEKLGAAHIIPENLHPLSKEVLKTNRLSGYKEGPMVEMWETCYMVKQYDELIECMQY